MNVLSLIIKLNNLLEEQRSNPDPNKNYPQIISDYMKLISEESIRFHSSHKK